MEIEANTEVDIDIVNVATVRVRGGRPEAQKTAESLEERWSREVAPHLAAVNVADLDGLSAKIAEAQELDSSIKAKGAELESLQGQIVALADPAHALREASDRSNACRAALRDVPPDTLARSPPGSQRLALTRRVRCESGDNSCRATSRWRVRRRTRPAWPTPWRRNVAGIRKSTREAAVVARDAALTAFPDGIATALSAAQAALAAASGEQGRLRPS